MEIESRVIQNYCTQLTSESSTETTDESHHQSWVHRNVATPRCTLHHFVAAGLSRVQCSRTKNRCTIINKKSTSSTNMLHSVVTTDYKNNDALTIIPIHPRIPPQKGREYDDKCITVCHNHIRTSIAFIANTLIRKFATNNGCSNIAPFNYQLAIENNTRNLLVRWLIPYGL